MFTEWFNMVHSYPRWSHITFFKSELSLNPWHASLSQVSNPSAKVCVKSQVCELKSESTLNSPICKSKSNLKSLSWSMRQVLNPRAEILVKSQVSELNAVSRLKSLHYRCESSLKSPSWRMGQVWNLRAEVWVKSQISELKSEFLRSKSRMNSQVRVSGMHVQVKSQVSESAQLEIAPWILNSIMPLALNNKNMVWAHY